MDENADAIIDSLQDSVAAYRKEVAELREFAIEAVRWVESEWAGVPSAGDPSAPIGAFFARADELGLL